MDKITNKNVTINSVEEIKKKICEISSAEHWILTGGDTYLSGHDHRNSPFETCDDCGNCSGARCDWCNRNTNPYEFTISSPVDKMEQLFIDAGMEPQEASKIYDDFDYPSGVPDQWDLAKYNRELYDKLCETSGFDPVEYPYGKDTETEQDTVVVSAADVYNTTWRDLDKFLGEAIIVADRESKKTYPITVTGKLDCEYPTFEATVSSNEFSYIDPFITMKAMFASGKFGKIRENEMGIRFTFGCGTFADLFEYYKEA